MVTAALEALVGGTPGDEAIDAALTTVPAAEIPDALRVLARTHGVAALPVLRRCLAGRREWATAAADALGTVRAPAAAALLATAELTAPTKSVRAAVRRALYRLRQAGVTPPTPPPALAPPAAPKPAQAWMSAVDGTGTRGVWLVLEGPVGERILISAIVNDQTGFLDGAAGSVTKKHLLTRLGALRADSPLPWVEVPPGWAVATLVEARDDHRRRGVPAPGDLDRWVDGLREVAEADAAPILEGPGEPDDDDGALERSAEILALPELASWFLDPPAVQADAVDLLQSRESRLVVSEQIRAERAAALVDRVIDRELTPAARRLWQRRLRATALVLARTGRPEPARRALAAARALGDPARPARHIPFVRGLVERSLEIAGEVALGKVAAADVSRQPVSPR
jgi:hypothetical protein